MGPPRIGPVTLRLLDSRTEQKVAFAAQHLKRELERELRDIKNLDVPEVNPAPLLRAETYYRYQIMLRTRQMIALSRKLAHVIESVALPDEVSLSIDIDPVDLA